MRFAIGIALAVALLSPSTTVGAQSGPAPCQTANGPKWFDTMLVELFSAGYSGPSDPSSVAAAYARTTGGQVACAASPASPALSVSPAAAPAAAASRTLVVFLSGLSELPVVGDAHWDPLVSQLEAQPFGYVSRDLALFSYADNPSGAGIPCQDVVTSVRQLDAFLQAERGAGYGRVVLVGHSFGGVLGVLTAMAHPELTSGEPPFVRSIVTVDSPLLGINYDRAAAWVTAYGQCRAVDQLYLIQQRGLTWENQLTSSVRQWAGHGTRFLAVANRSDCFFNPGACGLTWIPDGTRDEQVPDAGPGLNLVVDAVTDVVSHDAALYSPDVVLAIANAVGYQGA